MGTISPAIGHPVRTAALIGAEDEAITVAGTIAAIFDRAGPIGSTATSAAEMSQADTSQARLELLGRSGLFGVSVPTEHGGIDVSNTVLAEICALVSQTSASVGEILAAHFVAIEQLRSYGSDGQHSTLFPAALAGARLGRATPVQRSGDRTTSLLLMPSGVGWRLNGELLCTPCARHADWVLVPTRSEAGKSAMLLLPTGIDGLHYIANNCEPVAAETPRPEHVLVKDVFTDSASLLHAVADTARDVPHSLDLLLEGARQLGAGRRSLERALADGEQEPLSIGTASVRLAAAGAAIEQAGRAIDAAQIGLAEQHRTNAFLAAAAACVTATGAAQEVRAIFRKGPGGAADVATAAIDPHIADILREAGTVRLAAERQPPEDL